MKVPDGTGTRRAAWLASLLGLLCLVPVAYAVVAVLPAAPAVAADRTEWRLPLDGRPRVVAPFSAPAGPYAPGHRGVDLATRGMAPAGRVLAAAAGVVAFAGRVAGRGVVSVDHPGGLRTTYEPVEALVHGGDGVAVGAVLGLLAGAGGHCPPAACLHWGLRRGADYLDPMALLGSTRRVRLLPVWSASALPPAALSPAPAPALATDPRRASAVQDRPLVPRPRAPGPALLAGMAGLAGLATAAGSLRRRAPP